MYIWDGADAHGFLKLLIGTDGQMAAAVLWGLICSI